MSYRIDTELFGPYENFSHIIIDDATQKAVVIDPAWDADYIIERLERLGVTLEAIWLTHGHHDHTNAVDALRAKLPVPIYASQIEIDFIKNEPSALLSKVFLPLPEDVQGFHDGDQLSVGNTHVKIIHTPGHSSGSVCFELTDDLITGDTIFINGCGRADLPGSNPSDLYESLRKIVKTVPHHVTLHTGHAYGPSDTATLASQIENNPYLKRANRQEFLAYRMNH
ncbi:MBL fold metallo-hydrolase [Wohlfahrtiimonas chitiniclastica]|uniref:MBL fold metallo-hydrolase n=1 Tax=Wohlfahrtiimonas chitiniclastica TaxID=400946 RepID=UPI00036DB311|nr:MBL fold metallo-hydrolase [Wohlfahrtiimonas chitiniclastica]